jgi:predicted O-methyltransferase YrrM
VLVRRSPFVLERPASRRAARPDFSRVRLVRAQALNAYVRREQFASSHVVYHALLPGFAALDAERARALEQVLTGLPRAKFAAVHLRAVAALEKVGWIEPVRPDPARLVDRALGDFGALQNRRELAAFARVVAARRPKVVVEIGTARGGLLFLLSQLADPRATLASIDYPGGFFGGGQSDTECELFASFGPKTQRFLFLRDRSFHLSTREDLASALGGRGIDLLFIDGDHSYAAVRWDFEAYGSLVRPGGLIALHDVCLGPKNASRGFDVSTYFRALKRVYRARAIVDRKAPSRMPLPKGSGPISRDHQMGIGLIEIGAKARGPAFRV